MSGKLSKPSIMSWFTSIFSSNKNTSSNPSIPDPAAQTRVLEEPAPPPQPKEPSSSSSSIPQPSQPSSQPTRSKNPLLFTAGVTFFAFSVLVTRRAFARRRLAALPAYYTSSPLHIDAQAAKFSGGLEALEALNIATINVLSVAMMAAGGALWYLDVNSMEDLRRELRGRMKVDVSVEGEENKKEEREVEAWLAGALGKVVKKERTEGDRREEGRLLEEVQREGGFEREREKEREGEKKEKP